MVLPLLFFEPHFYVFFFFLDFMSLTLHLLHLVFWLFSRNSEILQQSKMTVYRIYSILHE